MNLSSFKQSLLDMEAPQEVSIYLKALWYDAKGDWEDRIN
jgi:hypothetical protein